MNKKKSSIVRWFLLSEKHTFIADSLIENENKRIKIRFTNVKVVPRTDGNCGIVWFAIITSAFFGGILYIQGDRRKYPIMMGWGSLFEDSEDPIASF